jgi:hypothetical protein
MIRPLTGAHVGAGSDLQAANAPERRASAQMIAGVLFMG